MPKYEVLATRTYAVRLAIDAATADEARAKVETGDWAEENEIDRECLDVSIDDVECVEALEACVDKPPVECDDTIAGALTKYVVCVSLTYSAWVNVEAGSPEAAKAHIDAHGWEDEDEAGRDCLEQKVVGVERFEDDEPAEAVMTGAFECGGAA